MTDSTVAKTILSQLVGNRFSAMTGAKMFLCSENSLSFRLPGAGFAKNNINSVLVTLTPMDVYDVKFSRIRGSNFKTVKEINGVYADQLQKLFTQTTGLQTHL